MKNEYQKLFINYEKKNNISKKFEKTILIKQEKVKARLMKNKET